MYKYRLAIGKYCQQQVVVAVIVEQHHDKWIICFLVLCLFLDISQSYATQYDRLLPWYCLSVCPCIQLCVMDCTVAKWYILQQKCLNKWIGSAPRNRILQFSTHTPTISPQNPHPQNLEILLIYKNFTFLIMWPCCLCWYEQSRILLLRCSMISYLSNSWASCLLLLMYQVIWGWRYGPCRLRVNDDDE